MMLTNVVLSFIFGLAVAISLFSGGAPLWLAIVSYGLCGAIALVALSLRDFRKHAPQSAHIETTPRQTPEPHKVRPV